MMRRKPRTPPPPPPFTVAQQLGLLQQWSSRERAVIVRGNAVAAMRGGCPIAPVVVEGA